MAFVVNFVFFLIIICNSRCHAHGNAETPQKRLVYHSDVDVAQEFAKLRQELQEQKNLINNLTEKLSKTSSDSGSTYIRWGRTTCSGNGTEIIYSGYMGTSSDYQQVGTGSNYLCLTGDPQWDHYEESIESLGKIAGVEYQFWNHRGNGASNFFGYNVYNDDAPCVACHTHRGSNIMIPGRTECYNGWTKEYSGYLASGFVGQSHDSEFICLDRRPEVVVGGKTDDDEAMLYFVEAVCGKSLECPPYINGRELTCVVCSK